MSKKSKKCKGCGKVFKHEELQPTHGKKSLTEPWCKPCAKSRAAAWMKNSRAQRHKKELLARNEELVKEGKQRCTVCLRTKLFSEYRTSQPHRQGKRRKICDACLTRAAAYKCPNDFSSPEYWRKRAYSVNTAARSRVKTLTGVEPDLADLPYECSPQDLLALYVKQGGKCTYCGVVLKPAGSVRKVVPSAINVDHYCSLAAGGAHSADNLVLSCATCNALKGTMHGDDFIDFVVEYAHRVLSSGIKG